MPSKRKLPDLHNFLTKQLPLMLFKKYASFQILNESDLQFEVRTELQRFLADPKRKRLWVHGCLSCTDFKAKKKTFPDLLVLKRDEPLIVIELKEQTNLKKATAEAERAKIAAQLATMGAKKGYFIYVGRLGKHRRLGGKKGPEHSFRFFEIPITLERYGWSEEEIDEFKTTFRQKSKRVFRRAVVS